MANFTATYERTWWDLIPLLTPTLKKNSCEVDYDLRRDRINTIFFTTMGFLVASAATAAVSIDFFAVAIIATPVLCIISLIADEILTTKASIAKAVDEYLHKPFPSRSAFYILRSNITALKQFIKKNGDVNKRNSEGDLLIDYHSDFNTFKLLVDNNANLLLENQYGSTPFHRIVGEDNPRKLEYVLRNKKIKSTDFTPQEQAKLWTLLENEASGQLLKHYGFDVNSRDEKGYTPLQHIVQSSFRSNFALIPILLNCGADPRLTVTINGEEKTTEQLTNDPYILSFLKQAK